MLPAQLKKYTSKGFTLIELLVVVGILGALTILALVTLNPAEAQKKARDVQRLKDVAVIQSIVEQYLQDNSGALNFTNAGTNSTQGTPPNDCDSGWLSGSIGKAGVGVNFCPYANVIPVDPTNRSTLVVATATTTESDLAAYKIRFSGVYTSGYKICTRLESLANASKLIGDGEALNGTANSPAAEHFAVFSDDNVVCP